MSRTIPYQMHTQQTHFKEPHFVPRQTPDDRRSNRQTYTNCFFIWVYIYMQIDSQDKKKKLMIFYDGNF